MKHIRKGRAWLGCVAIAAAVAGFGPAAANAQDMTGESLAAFFPFAPTTESDCQPDGTGTFTFRAEGIANGPYPGTFVETGRGTVVEGPTGDNILSDFAAEFTIDSTVGTITGTKTWVPGTTFASGGADCFTDANNDSGAGWASQLVYHTGGAVVDSGFSQVFVQGQGIFSESFTSFDSEDCREQDPRDLGFKNQGQCRKLFKEKKDK